MLCPRRVLQLALGQTWSTLRMAMFNDGAAPGCSHLVNREVSACEEGLPALLSSPGPDVPLDVPGRSWSRQFGVGSIMGSFYFLNAAFHLHQKLSLVLGGLDLIPY